MAENLAQRLAAAGDPTTTRAVLPLFQYLYDRLSCQLLSTSGLAIKAGGGVLVKTGTLCKYLCKGRLVSLAANTDQAALAGTVTNAKFNVFAFFIDEAGAMTSGMGTEATLLKDVKWPSIPQRTTMLGFVIINPTGTGNFVGNTTALDDATVVPNAVYVNTVGSIDPSATYTT